MLFSTFGATALLLLPFVSARGRRGGGGSGGGGGATSVVYATSNGTRTEFGNGSSYYIRDDKINNSTNYLMTLKPNVSWEMEVLDTYYNGKFYMTLTPPSNTTYNCTELTSQEIPNAFLRVGPQSRGNVSRSSYDDMNSYYFKFGRSNPDQKYPYTANKAFIAFESSNDELLHSQEWTLNQKKSGDHFDLDGALTSPLANYWNYWNYIVNTTSSDKNYHGGCPTNFSVKTLLANSGAKMTATVSANTAKMEFEFQDEENNWHIRGTFTGNWWDKGPKLVMSGDKIMTDGETTHVKPRPPKASVWEKYSKWIIISVVAAVLLFIAYLLFQFFSAIAMCVAGCFRCCLRRSSKENKAVRAAEPMHEKWCEEQYGNTSDVEQQQGITPHMTAKQPAEAVTPARQTMSTTTLPPEGNP